MRWRRAGPGRTRARPRRLRVRSGVRCRSRSRRIRRTRVRRCRSLRPARGAGGTGAGRSQFDADDLEPAGQTGEGELADLLAACSQLLVRVAEPLGLVAREIDAPWAPLLLLPVL